MSKYGKTDYKISARILRKKQRVFTRQDFSDLAGYRQTGRILNALVEGGKLVKIGRGLYAKAKKARFVDRAIPVAPLPELAKEALERLGVEVVPSRLDQAYNEGRTTQVPTGRLIAVRGRVSRKISYNGAQISYERRA